MGDMYYFAKVANTHAELMAARNTPVAKPVKSTKKRVNWKLVGECTGGSIIMAGAFYAIYLAACFYVAIV